MPVNRKASVLHWIPARLFQRRDDISAYLTIELPDLSTKTNVTFLESCDRTQRDADIHLGLLQAVVIALWDSQIFPTCYWTTYDNVQSAGTLAHGQNNAEQIMADAH